LSEFNDLIQEFVTEASEHLADIEEDLIKIEADRENIEQEVINRVFRAAHSIKGSAKFLDLHNIGNLAHRMEDVFLEAMFYLVIAGALGNLTDRLRFKEVVDFLNFHIGALSWPTFNMADTYISIAIVGIFIRTFVKGNKARSR